MSENYISQFYTWATGNTITAPRLNGNVSNVTDGLSSGVKAVNIGKLLIGGTETINSSRNGIFNGITLSSDITTISYAIDWDLQDNVASALSFDASGKTGLLEFDTTDGAEGLKSSGFLRLGSDASALTDVGAFVLGASNDSGLFFNGTDLVIQTDGAGASGIIFDSEDDTFEFKGSGTLQATFDTTGLNLVSGDVFKINGTSVLSNDTLGSGVVNTSITSTGALNSGSITSGFGNIDVGSSNIDGGTITADTALVGTLSTASQTNITSVGTLTSLTVSGDATFDTSTLKVDSTNDRVGIGLSSPSHRLDIDDSSLNSGNPGTVARIKASGTTSTAVTALNVQDSFYVNGSGNVGIGTSSPTSLMHLATSGGSTILTMQRTNTNTTGSIGDIIFNASDNHTVAGIRAIGDGNNEGADLVFGTTSNASGNGFSNINIYMRIASTGLITGDFNDTSDITLKKNVRDFEKTGLEIIKKIKPRIFDWKDEEKGDNIFGFIAQELDEVMPTAVIHGDVKSINVTSIVSVLAKSVQELAKKVEILENK